MYAILVMLLSATALFAQQWRYSTVTLNPQPMSVPWSRVRILPLENGVTAISAGAWDYWQPITEYDSLGLQVWGPPSDPLIIELSRTFALDLIPTASGYVGLFYRRSSGGPNTAYAWLLHDNAHYQSLALNDTVFVSNAAHDGIKSYFMVGNYTDSLDNFIAAVSDIETEWTLPLSDGETRAVPYGLCRSTREGIALLTRRYGPQEQGHSLSVVDTSGNLLLHQPITDSDMLIPAKMCAANDSGYWVVGTQYEGQSEELRLYRSADDTYHSLPLDFTLPPFDYGYPNSLHVVPFGNGVLVAGEAVIEDEACLFTLLYMNSGESQSDVIHGFNKIFDLTAVNDERFIAAIGATANSPIEILRARYLSTAADPTPEIPKTFSLSSYPNPFNAQTTITFDLPRAGAVSLRLFDVLGREVETLLDEPLAAGTHTHNVTATQLPSGVYFVSLQFGNAAITHKLLLLK